MPTLTDLVRRHTDLCEADLRWLHALVSDWQLIADLSFADLVLWAPAAGGAGWLGIAQVRPATGPTAHQDDLVGSLVPRTPRSLLDTAWDEGRICREGEPVWRNEIPARDETIPVRRAGRLIGVLLRSTNLNSARTPSRLELTYLQCAGDLARMVAGGYFPFVTWASSFNSTPRVGDGLLRLDSGGNVLYASPNGQSAYRRLGLSGDLVGIHLGEMTSALAPCDEPVDEALSAVASGRTPRETEIEAGGTIVTLRAIPLLPEGARIGAIVLVRDVTEVRSRERELLTKDATIREIHHRVKNNLQTVAALLRLQARRIGLEEGRAALDEAVRRVGSIAIVHETLSRTPDEHVDFDEVVDRVMAMAGEVSSPVSSVAPHRTGTFGVLPAAVATPLAMVLTELLQNALAHGLGDRPGLLEVTARHAGARLRVSVSDDGRGLPADFDIEETRSLGLQIVRTLVIGELDGRLDIGPREGGGTRVLLDLPLDA
ncbi:MAG: sensor histidine kinase [Streptosporangiaceae bacterium]